MKMLIESHCILHKCNFMYVLPRLLIHGLGKFHLALLLPFHILPLKKLSINGSALLGHLKSPLGFTCWFPFLP